MRDIDAQKLVEMVRESMEWSPKEEPDAMLEEINKQDFKRRPIVVKKCCRDCIYLNPNNTCENFRPPNSRPDRETGEWIPLPRQLIDSMYCEAWIEVELAKLVLRGYKPGGIAYGRRQPQVEIPPSGLENFGRYFESIPQNEHPSEVKSSGQGEDTEWPEMDARIKEILMIVEQKGNQGMWSQYQGNLFLLGGPISYIKPVLDRLEQKPDSPVKDFFLYVIKTHGSNYYGIFSGAGTNGVKTFDHILTLLNHPSKNIRDISVALLLAISKNSRKKPPVDSTDPNLWRGWAREEFIFWKSHL